MGNKLEKIRKNWTLRFVANEDKFDYVPIDKDHQIVRALSVVPINEETDSDSI